MDLIDDDGKVFGIINLIDLVALLFFILVITSAVSLFNNRTINDVFENKVIDLTNNNSRQQVDTKLVFYAHPNVFCNQANLRQLTTSTNLDDCKLQNTPILLETIVKAEKKGPILYYDNVELKTGQNFSINVNITGEIADMTVLN